MMPLNEPCPAAAAAAGAGAGAGAGAVHLASYLRRPGKRSGPVRSRCYCRPRIGRDRWRAITRETASYVRSPLSKITPRRAARDMYKCSSRPMPVVKDREPVK